MKILITGGTSNLGVALKSALGKSHEVITAGRSNCDIILDLRNPSEAFIFPNGIDVIIHTAAHFGGKSPEQIIECEEVNVVGTLKLCQASTEAKVGHFILISSIFESLKPGSPYFSIYSLSKKHCEEAVGLYCSIFSMPLTILRPSQIYGSGEGFRKHQPFFYAMADKAEMGEDILIYGSNDALRNFIHVDDLVAIITRVISNKITGTYGCNHPEDLTYSQIAKAALSAFKSNASVLFLKHEPDIPDNIFEKDDSLYKKIDFFPRISISEGMNMIQKNRNNQH